jgi:multidrug resistance efflux pump
VFSEQNFVSSSNAVVSAYVVVVRTPIDSLVQALPAAPNLHVQRGQNLGYVENSPVDEQHLENLRVIVTHADLASPISGLLWKLDAVNGLRAHLRH